jgi:hypothetical protein
MCGNGLLQGDRSVVAALMEEEFNENRSRTVMQAVKRYWTSYVG